MRLLAALLLALCAGLGAARAEVPVPPLHARVTDLTGTLSAQQKGELEATLAAYETRRGSQMAVLLVPTTKPEDIEQYSIRVAEAWKVGRKGADDGVILIVAKDDRRLRIEVGYGLEGAIPDALAKRVIDERIVPRFREGDLYGGVRDGVEQLIRLAEGEKLPPPQARPPQALGLRGFVASNPAYFMMFAIFFLPVAGAILRAMLGRFAGALAVGAILGGAGWVFFGLVGAFFAGLVGFVTTYANSGFGSGGGSGWSSGGSGSSGSSWGGSSGGSSSSWGGGGGGFGGGGASGRW